MHLNIVKNQNYLKTCMLVTEKNINSATNFYAFEWHLDKIVMHSNKLLPHS